MLIVNTVVYHLLYLFLAAFFNDNNGNLFRLGKGYFFFEYRMNFNHFKWYIVGLEKTTCFCAEWTGLILIKLDSRAIPFFVLKELIKSLT